MVYSTKEQNNKTHTFHLGAGNVIEGWEQGVLGMCIGETKSFKVPSQLVYIGIDQKDTDTELSNIPMGTTLIFDVELIDIHEISGIPTLYSQMDSNSDMFISFDEMEVWFLRRRPSLVSLVRTAFDLDDTNRV